MNNELYLKKLVKIKSNLSRGLISLIFLFDKSEFTMNKRISAIGRVHIRLMHKYSAWIELWFIVLTLQMNGYCWKQNIRLLNPGCFVINFVYQQLSFVIALKYERWFSLFYISFLILCKIHEKHKILHFRAFVFSSLFYTATQTLLSWVKQNLNMIW